MTRDTHWFLPPKGQGEHRSGQAATDSTRSRPSPAPSRRTPSRLRLPRVPLPRPVDAAERIERTPALDHLVQVLAEAVVRALPTGRRTDALHGVPFGQPAHPALVRLPLGCWTSAVLLDLLPGTRPASRVLIAIGVAGALPSTAAGLADWSALHRHQQRVGFVHAAVQAGATVLFGGSLIASTAGSRRAGTVLAASGLATAAAGAYLGGHLALRLGAGASHAEPIAHLASLGWNPLCRVDELPNGRPVRRQFDYLSLFVLRRDALVYVLADHCAHLGGPLHQGRVPRWEDRCQVACPWHGSTFDVRNGAVVHGPATARQPAFHTRVDADGVVLIRPRE